MRDGKPDRGDRGDRPRRRRERDGRDREEYKDLPDKVVTAVAPEVLEDVAEQRKRTRRRKKPRVGKRKACRDCDFMDFKELNMLAKNCNVGGKLQSRKRNGTCAKCQRLIKEAVKRARYMALMPYIG